MLGFHPRHSNRNAASVGADEVRARGRTRYPRIPVGLPLERKAWTLFVRVRGRVGAERKVGARRAAYRLCTTEAGTLMRRKPRGDPGDRQRQQQLRDRRKADGWRRVSIWLSPNQVARLVRHGGEEGLGRTVKRLLAWADPDLGADNPLDDGARRADRSAVAISDNAPQTQRKESFPAISGTLQEPLRENDRDGDLNAR